MSSPRRSFIPDDTPARQIADRYGVSGKTVTNAIAVLREQGLVTTRQGSQGRHYDCNPGEQTPAAAARRSEDSRSSPHSSWPSAPTSGGSAPPDELDERTKDR